MADRVDVLIEGATVVDGTGAPGFTADVAIAGGRIAAVGRLADTPATRRIEADGAVVCPGFIDMHSHSDLSILAHPDATSRIVQGITTELVGNCGHSPAPVVEETAEEMRRWHHASPAVYDFTWRSMADFFARVEAAGPATNQAALVGHGTVRAAVLGFADRAPSADELARMQALVADAMRDGAFGLSSGLIYAPGAYGTTAEVAALARAAAPYGGFYATHMRDEADGLMDALNEAITIGREGGVPVQISHLKLAGTRQHGRAAEAIGLIERARLSGVDAAADFYPYTAGSTGLNAMLPPWVLDGGLNEMVERLRSDEVRRRIAAEIEGGLAGWWNPIGASGGWQVVLVTRVPSPERRDLQGLRVDEIARRQGKAPIDAVADLLIAEGGSVQIVLFMMDDRDVAQVARTPWVAMGTDGAATSPAEAQSLVHPRTYGTTARFLGYVRSGDVALEDAIARMTAQPARRLGLSDRGRIAPGQMADVVVLDPATVEDRATYDNPHVAPAGFLHVFVNGVAALSGGAVTGERPGRVLRHRTPG